MQVLAVYAKKTTKLLHFASPRISLSFVEQLYSRSLLRVVVALYVGYAACISIHSTQPSNPSVYSYEKRAGWSGEGISDGSRRGPKSPHNVHDTFGGGGRKDVVNVLA